MLALTAKAERDCSLLGQLRLTRLAPIELVVGGEINACVSTRVGARL